MIAGEKTIAIILFPAYYELMDLKQEISDHSDARTANKTRQAAIEISALKIMISPSYGNYNLFFAPCGENHMTQKPSPCLTITTHALRASSRQLPRASPQPPLLGALFQYWHALLLDLLHDLLLDLLLEALPHNSSHQIA